MATPDVAFTIHLALGAATTGLWCHRCLLPSAASWPLYGIYPHGVIELGTLTACHEHDDAAARAREAVQQVARELHGTVVEG